MTIKKKKKVTKTIKKTKKVAEWCEANRCDRYKLLQLSCSEENCYFYQQLKNRY